MQTPDFVLLINQQVFHVKFGVIIAFGNLMFHQDASQYHRP